MAGEFGSRSGRVVTFDDPAGYGTVQDDDGQEHPFHCTAIAGGGRTIEVGAEVCYDVVPGRQGRWEATNLTPR